MKRLFVVFLFVSGFAAAQIGPVVSNATVLEWDYAPDPDTDFRIYCSPFPGVDLTQPPVATVPPDTHTWAIAGLPSGQQYCAVTAHGLTEDVESGPSNELSFFIKEAPTGFRIQP